MTTLKAGDLYRVKSQEADESWPVQLEVVAYFGPGRTKRRSIEVSADEFFGKGRFGAPMGIERFTQLVNQLRRK